jgi:A/G-specific adenine glycosylase
VAPPREPFSQKHRSDRRSRKTSGGPALRSNGAISRWLLAWYRKNHRDLPWRRTKDPYRIWISEIMLQQTQVATVLPYYDAFITRFPTVKALAAAPLQKVLKAWEGLGYYRRASNLHRTARLIIANGRGNLPRDPEELEALPGIGRSTAGAIASIAHGIPAPILDGNVRRVISRILSIQENPGRPAVQKRLWEVSESLIPRDDAGDFNQSLMELGATVCLPRTPRCAECPVSAACGARQDGLQNQIPARGNAKPVPFHQMWVALVQRGDSILMGPRPREGLLAGLWAPPETPAPEAPAGVHRPLEVFSRKLKLNLEWIGPLKPVVHTYSHLRVTYIPFLFESRGKPKPLHVPWKWARASRLSEYPQSTATRRILEQIRPGLGSTNENLLAAERVEIYSASEDHGI